MKKYISKSEKETFEFSKNLAASFKGGEIICLEGNLGAGKTVFSKGIAYGLGYKNNVNSPTFIVMKVYDIENKNIKNLVHIDAYRLQGIDDLISIGVQEYFEKKDTVVIIEWPEKIKKILPKNILWIKINIKEDEHREIIFN